MHQSIATIDSPEFINLEPLDINPLMSKCEIKVFYLGENRNHSYITKDVATEMAKTLRGAPIVGYYKDSKEDFADHGEKVTFDDEGIHFECMTRPYGFVAPDAKVWFQKFDDYDDFGNSVTREYLMTTGYLWTGQYEECKSVVEGDGKPHSMELDEETLDGRWSENIKTGMDFFIINDAIISKLCVLGDDVEPCFEGSSVTAPKVSASFNLDDGFKQTLFTMMQDLKAALEGGNKMSLDENTVVTPEADVTPNTEDTFTEGTDNVDNIVQNDATENQENIETPVTEDFSKKEDDEDKKSKCAKQEDDEDKKSKCAKQEDEEKKDDSSEDKKDEEEEDEDKKKFSALSAEHEALKAQFSELQKDYQALIAFKNEVESAKKDEMIKSFYMLSDEDKKEVVDNKDKFTLEEIESKLSVIFTKKSLAEMSIKTESDAEEKPTVTFGLDDASIDSVPAWISAVRNTKNSRN